MNNGADAVTEFYKWQAKAWKVLFIWVLVLTLSIVSTTVIGQFKTCRALASSRQLVSGLIEFNTRPAIAPPGSSDQIKAIYTQAEIQRQEFLNFARPRLLPIHCSIL